MKRIILLVLAAMLMLSSAACTSSTGSKGYMDSDSMDRPMSTDPSGESRLQYM